MKLTVKCFATLMPLTPPGGSLEFHGTDICDLLRQLSIPESEARIIFVNGIGVEKDQGKVLFWLKRAAAMGDRDAIQTLQKYYPKQTLVKTNDQLDEELPKEFVETTPGTIN